MSLEILSDLIINEIHTVAKIYSAENACAKRKSRERWAIIIKYEGETVYRSNNKNYVSNINNIMILPKGCSYDWVCTRAGHFYIIEFESDNSHSELLSFPVKDGESILKMFKELEYKRTAKAPMWQMEGIRDAYSIIIKLARAWEKKYFPSEKTDKIAPVIHYIAQNYAQKVDNDELAAVTGMSTVYFRKLFTEIYGISPMEYVHSVRIEKAKEMLRSDYGSITDIALSLGYSNIYDFSRDFKKRTGTSPSKY